MRARATDEHRPWSPTALVEAADALLALGREGTHPAGAVVGVRIGSTAGVAARGTAVVGADGDPRRPMTADTLLDLASVTKIASTTALAMRLVADGSLDLDERVAEYLPCFATARSGSASSGSASSGSPSRAAVTVRRLLEHTSGLPPWRPLYCHTTDRDEALTLAATTPLATAPGTSWVYSDLAMIVLGAVLEQVAGQRQDLAFAELVAEPLGLARTAYGPVPAGQSAAGADSDVIEHQMVATSDPYPTTHAVTDFGGWRDRTVMGEAADGNAAHALGGIAGHAGLFTTVPELLVLGRSLVDPEVIPEDVIREFTTPQQMAPDCGLGFRLVTASVAGQQVPMAVHAGFTGTWLGTALDRDLVVAACATRLHTTTGRMDTPRTRRSDLVGTTEIAATVLDHLGSIVQEHDGLSATPNAPSTGTGAP